jgi:quercetin dioxygenase-like cupin family protein
MSIKRIRAAALLALLLALAVMTAATVAGATPASGVTAETLARGTHAGPLKTNIKVGGVHIKFQASGSVDVVTQRITIAPGGTTGWHSHPGPNFNPVAQGVVTLYHGDDPSCTGKAFSVGSGFFGPGLDVHLVRNEGAAPAVIYSTFIVPAGADPIRIDEPAPGNCPF